MVSALWTSRVSIRFIAVSELLYESSNIIIFVSLSIFTKDFSNTELYFIEESFFLGKKGKEDCQGGAPITDKATCESACIELDIPVKKLSDGFVCYQNKKGKCFQNGKNNHKSRLVCKK